MHPRLRGENKGTNLDTFCQLKVIITLLVDIGGEGRGQWKLNCSFTHSYIRNFDKTKLPLAHFDIMLMLGKVRLSKV